LSIVYYFLWRAAKSNGIWCITVANFSKRAGVVHDKELRDQNVSFTGWCGWGAVTNRREAWRASEVRVLRGWHVREKGIQLSRFCWIRCFYLWWMELAMYDSSLTDTFSLMDKVNKFIYLAKWKTIANYH
jgi:hypothetical protein